MAPGLTLSMKGLHWGSNPQKDAESAAHFQRDGSDAESKLPTPGCVADGTLTAMNICCGGGFRMTPQIQTGLLVVKAPPQTNARGGAAAQN